MAGIPVWMGNIGFYFHDAFICVNCAAIICRKGATRWATRKTASRVNLAGARLVWHQIYPGFNRRIIQIQRWRRNIVPNSQNAENCLCRPSCAKQMTNRRFG